METYKLIIKKHIKTNINFFDPDYKEDKTIKFYITLSFSLFEKDLNFQNKYKKLSETLDGFLLVDKKKQEEFTREIIQFVFNKKLLTYFECKYQFQLGVLESNEWLNTNILGKFFSKDFATQE